MIFRTLVFTIYLCTNFIAITQSWDTSIKGLGSFSSPRVSDLNGDGIDDIILGTGREEFVPTDSGVIALNGKDGRMLWHIPTIDQMFGSAIFQDVTKDGHADVLICGRSSELILIDGFKGKIIWRFDSKQKKYKHKKYFNFYNPQWIPDENGDGLLDILISNGGDVLVAAYDPKRDPGYLMGVNTANGEILYEAQMPDGKEIYMSVTASPVQNDIDIIYGTGGETLGGHLYKTTLSALRKSDITNSLVLDSCQDRGYIGPAARADINQDGVSDLFVNTVDGRMLSFDGKTYQKIWEIKRPGTETYSSIAIGQFTDDAVPDVFASYAMGSWPNLEWSTQFMADGKTGKIKFIDSLGFYQNSSGISIDVDGDGRDEVVLSVNFQEIKNGFQKYFYHMLALIDFKSGEVLQLGKTTEGNNISSTPWAGDLDHDGFLDIVYVHGTNLRHNFTFDGMAVHRMSTKIPVKKNLKWGAYQGSDYNGTYKN